MSLKVLVLARWNDGNASVIENRKTGLLFRTPKVFQEKACSLMLHCSSFCHSVINQLVMEDLEIFFIHKTK